MMPEKPSENEIICPAQDRAWLNDAPQCLIEMLEWNEIVHAELAMQAREIGRGILNAS